MDDIKDEGLRAEAPDEEHPNLVNANPNFLMETYNNVTTFFASYGWPVLFGTILCFIIWSNIEPKLKALYEKLTKKNDIEDTDPEVLAKRAEEMEIARMKMQEKASAIVKRDEERRKELEEKKRGEKLQDYDDLRAGRSLTSTQRKLKVSGKANPEPATGNRPNRSDGSSRRDDDNSYPLLRPSAPRYRPTARSSGGG